MLTAADLKPPKQECWFNVYHNGSVYGLYYGSKEACIAISFSLGVKLLYRIHVILK